MNFITDLKHGKRRTRVSTYGNTGQRLDAPPEVILTAVIIDGEGRELTKRLPFKPKATGKTLDGFTNFSFTNADALIFEWIHTGFSPSPIVLRIVTSDGIGIFEFPVKNGFSKGDAIQLPTLTINGNPIRLADILTAVSEGPVSEIGVVPDGFHLLDAREERCAGDYFRASQEEPWNLATGPIMSERAGRANYWIRRNP